MLPARRRRALMLLSAPALARSGFPIGGATLAVDPALHHHRRTTRASEARCEGGRRPRPQSLRLQRRAVHRTELLPRSTDSPGVALAAMHDPVRGGTRPGGGLPGHTAYASLVLSDSTPN
ncbi:hypothetical protein PVAP13_7KG017300 [Panicum virgatum]|uniref:Uncharacterized protein n=1 Tax=Panicum virgatum TaxID=38727 RepID=A0A8T0QFF1_PANVG|nr:hypothetical protein PVAP13_7KG017300 [Panicum virgatum]